MVRSKTLATATVLVALATGVLSNAACQNGAAKQESGWEDPELEARVEELLPGVAELSALEIRETPRVRRASRSTLERYLLDRLELEYPGDSIKSIELAYRAFGLLPDTVDLRELLVDLLLEQAVGYYDPSLDVLFIREEVPSATIDGVIVHELVHALQDQRADLDSLLRSRVRNDAKTAVQGAIEGHATLVMLAYMVQAASGTAVPIESLPDLTAQLSAGLVDPSTMPLLATAPAIIRETLLFSYVGGARFVQTLWKAEKGRPPPFGEWLPASTEQLLHTNRFLVDRDPPTDLSLEGQIEGWDRRYTSDLGELEIQIYLEEHLGDVPLARRAAEGWDGDVYAVITREDVTGLIWYSVWDSDSDADEFVDAYRTASRARFATSSGDGTAERETRVDRLDLAGRPAVRVIELPPGVEIDGLPQAVIR